MGKKRNTKKKVATDPGLGFSPYLADKAMTRTKSHKDKQRDERRQTKRNLKRGEYD